MDVIQAPPHLHVQISCVRSENSFKQNQKPYRKYVFGLSAGTGHRWEIGFRYSELQSLYDHIVKQFPKHKLSPFPAKVNPFKPEHVVIQERQAAFDTITKEMFSHQDICDCFQLQHFFQIKKHIYGENVQGTTQGMLWIKVIEAIGLEFEENPKAELSPQLKMRVSVPLNHSFHPPTLATQVFNNNKHAKWFEEFSMSVPNKEFPVQFKVWNHRTLASNQLLGRFELDIRPFASNQVHDLWLQISKTARLHVMFQFSESLLPSEPKNHINLKLPDLRLVLDRNTVYPGEVVTGGVIFNVGNPLTVKDITLKFFGAEHTRWKQEFCRNGKDHNGHRLPDTHFIRRSETAVLFNVDQLLFAQQPIIDSGSYYWPFSFVMPLNLPPTMDHPFAEVTYTCSAHVNRPGFGSKHVSNDINVVVNYASAAPGPAVTSKEKKLNFRSKDQVILLTGKLEEGNIADIGGQKLLSFTIENKSNYDIKSMKIALRSTLETSANGFYKNFCNSIALSQLDGREGMGLPVRAGRTLTGQIELKFPTRLFPTIFSQFSPLISVSHALVMECSVSGFLTGSVTTSIPMVFNNNKTGPELAKIQQPSLPQGNPMTVSFDFMPNSVTPMPPIDSPALFERQYGVNYLALNQMPDATPQFD